MARPGCIRATAIPGWRRQHARAVVRRHSVVDIEHRRVQAGLSCTPQFMRRSRRLSAFEQSIAGPVKAANGPLYPGKSATWLDGTDVAQPLQWTGCANPMSRPEGPSKEDPYRHRRLHWERDERHSPLVV